MANHGIAITATNDIGTVTSDTTATAGTLEVSPTKEAFLSYDTSAVVDTDDIVTSRVQVSRSSAPTGNLFDMEAYVAAWSPGPVTAADGLLGRGNFLGSISNADAVSSFLFSSQLSAASTSKTGRTDLRLEWIQRSGQPAAGNVVFNGVAAATTSKPMIRIRTAPSHVLRGCGGAFCQLSDGTHLFVSYAGSALSISRIPVGATSAIAVLTITSLYGFDPAYEAFSITRDVSDNLFIIGPAPASLGNGFVIRRFDKTGTTTWADSGVYRFQSLPTSQRVTATSIQWYDPPSTSFDRWVTGHVRCTPSGGGSFSTDGGLGGSMNWGPMPQYVSDCGTLLDSTKSSPTSSTVQHMFPTVLSDSATGALLVNGATANFGFTDSANIKGRLFAISDTSTVAIYPFATTTYDTGTNTETTVGGGWRAAYLAPGSSTPVIRTLTTATNLNVADSITFRWDAAYDASAQTVWLYYIDSTGTQIRRTAFSLSAQDWLGDSTTLATGATAVASCLSISAARGPLATSSVLLFTASATTSLAAYDSLTAPVAPPTSAPAPPIVTTAAGDGYIQLAITNPTTSGFASPSYNDVFRRRVGDTVFAKVKSELVPNATWKDYGVASDVGYEYYVEAVAF